VDDRQNASAIPSVTGGLADLHSCPLPWTGLPRAPRRAAVGRPTRPVPARGTGACRRVAVRQPPGIGDRIM